MFEQYINYFTYYVKKVHIYIYDLIQKYNSYVKRDRFNKISFLNNDKLCKLSFYHNQKQYTLCLSYDDICSMKQDNDTLIKNNILAVTDNKENDLTNLFREYQGPYLDSFEYLGLSPKLTWILNNNIDKIEIFTKDFETIELTKDKFNIRLNNVLKEKKDETKIDVYM